VEKQHFIINLVHNLYVHNSNCMFHANTYASETKVFIINEDLID